MKNLHTRIIVLNYFEDDVPLHTSLEEQQEWYAALGRMVAYGLYNDRSKAEDSTTQYVSLGFRKNPVEIDACYHKQVLQPRYEDGDPKYVGTAHQALRGLQDTLTTPETCFVMGAVLHSGGKCGFHS